MGQRVVYRNNFRPPDRLARQPNAHNRLAGGDFRLVRCLRLFNDCVHEIESRTGRESLRHFRKSDHAPSVQPNAVDARLRREIKRLPVRIALGHIVRMLRAVQRSEMLASA